MAALRSTPLCRLAMQMILTIQAEQQALAQVTVCCCLCISLQASWRRIFPRAHLCDCN